MSDADDYNRIVDTAVIAAVYGGPTSFDDLVCHLPGIYPTDARDSLDRLLASAQIDDAGHARAIERRPLPAQPPRSMGLSVPHPLDFDWRFSDAGLDTVIGATTELVEPDDPLICLGAPSIVRRMQVDDHRRPAILVDANPLPVAVIGTDDSRHFAHQCRLGTDALPKFSAPVVVIDPPWYAEYFDVFLWAAARLVTQGGYVLVSYPAVGTRPGVTAERDASLTWASALGLDLQEIRRNTVGYRSPPFERAALEAAGLGDLPGDWRRGDLLILRAERPADPVAVAKPLQASEWVPIPAGPTQIRVRAGRTGTVLDPRFFSVVDGDVLPTVSRRDPRRDLVDVWTANQRVYGCANTDALATVAAAMAEGADAEAAVAGAAGRDLVGDEASWITEAVDQLSGLVDREVADLRRYRWLDET